MTSFLSNYCFKCQELAFTQGLDVLSCLQIGESWRDSLRHSSSSSSSHQALSTLLCVGLSVQVQGPTLSQPTVCGMGMSGVLNGSAQPLSSLFPPKHPCSTHPALSSSPHDSSVVRLWPLSPPVNPVSSSMIGHEQHGTDETLVQSASTVFKGQRPETTFSVDAFFSLCELGQHQGKKHLAHNRWQFWY